MTNPMQQTQPGLSMPARLTRWWKAQTPMHRRALFARAGLGVVCFSAIMVGMPLLSNVNTERQDDQQFRERNQRLAVAQDAGVALRSDEGASPLLRHDWLRSVEYSLERDPASALSRYAALERDRAALSGLPTLEIGAMARAEDMAVQTKCLAQAVYYEARSEKASGQLAVAEVIMNRVKDHRYPNSVCEVVFQGATRTTGCQFTFTCDGALRRTPRGTRWDAAKTVATHVMMELNESKTRGATHYHATYVNPVWNSGLIRTSQIGTHIFYRFPRGGEWAAASARQSRRLAQRRSGLSTLVPASASVDTEPTVVKAVGSVPESSGSQEAVTQAPQTEAAPAPTEAANLESSAPQGAVSVETPAGAKTASVESEPISAL